MWMNLGGAKWATDGEAWLVDDAVCKIAENGINS
jgi:hypothetical protein